MCIRDSQLIDTIATKNSFMEKAKNASIIHLAAHGFYDALNDSVPNFLYFQPTATDNGILTIEELYSLNLNADLVVLSSCHSNEGKFNLIEGAMSFSRAFFHTGCKATIATTDDVEEAKTAKIITLFYDYMQHKGLPPHAALNESQRTYLKEAINKANIYAHPVYWVNYRHTGIDALQTNVFSNKTISALGN